MLYDLKKGVKSIAKTYLSYREHRIKNIAYTCLRLEECDDSSAGSKALAKFVRKRTIQPPAPSASAISTFAAQNGIWRLAWPGEEAVGLLPPDDLFQEDPG